MALQNIVDNFIQTNLTWYDLQNRKIMSLFPDWLLFPSYEKDRFHLSDFRHNFIKDPTVVIFELHYFVRSTCSGWIKWLLEFTWRNSNISNYKLSKGSISYNLIIVDLISMNQCKDMLEVLTIETWFAKKLKGNYGDRLTRARSTILYKTRL